LFIIVSEGEIVLSKDDEITKEFLENILESMEGGIFTVDKNARITSKP